MKRAAPLLLLLAACRSSPPPGERAALTLYGDAPRLESWLAFAALLKGGTPVVAGAQADVAP